jgi:hypothetical protein
MNIAQRGLRAAGHRERRPAALRDEKAAVGANGAGEAERCGGFDAPSLARAPVQTAGLVDPRRMPFWPRRSGRDHAEGAAVADAGGGEQQTPKAQP